MRAISQFVEGAQHQTYVRLLPGIAADELRSPGHRIGLALCHTRADKIHE
jgi:hypothetical protein